ncbi:hypothetical protein [Candidatus Accumulibacter sp. ACC005]|uniref:hypothetical protein n=1 Tax=Candidatus Accumulibacter sp. ACC005 TaxID=2823331 RepID=UPI0025BA6B7E|nr:hypothetical protein [Candidatus Accumulibacter sp. ACC005]
MTTETENPCPICAFGTPRVETFDSGERLRLKCPRCGKFTITQTVLRTLGERQVATKLSAWIRNRNEKVSTIPEISRASIESIISSFPILSVIDKQALLLEIFGRRSKYPGSSVPFDSSLDFPLIWGENPNELEFHLKALITRGLVQAGNQQKAAFAEGSPEYILTAAGWTYLDDLNRPRSISTQAFVAMSFDAELTSAWKDGIKPAIERARYSAFRTDAQPSVDRIDVRIMAEIKRSHLVVADVTRQRPGVYFEAGYAIGLGIPVYWCVRKDDLQNVHFDTRQYNHIVWENPDDLRAQLYDFIYAVSGPSTAIERAV